jgi:dihydroxyacetone kinase
MRNRAKRIASLIRQTPKPVGKVGVASGGGFGHLPLFAGYVH